MQSAELYKTRHETIAEKLEQQLIKLPPKTKLPTVRSLMERFNVSQATIDRGLQNLADKDLIERIPGRGYFTKDPNGSRREQLKIDFCFFFKKNTLNNPLYSEISGVMLTEMYHRGCHLNILAYEDMGCIDEFKRRLKESRPDAFIMLGCSKITFEYALRELNIPAIQLYPNVQDSDSLSYIIDNHKAIELSINHLTELGHEQIAMLHGQGYDGFYMLDQEERIEAFYDVMAKKNLPAVGERVLYGGFSPETGYEATMKLLSASRYRRPTAILCNDYNVGGVYAAISASGLRIPEDISVIGFDKISQIECLPVRLTTVDIEWREMLKALSEKAHKLAAGEQYVPGKVRTDVELSLGNSTGPAPNLT